MMICLKGVRKGWVFRGMWYSKLLICQLRAKTGEEKVIKNKLIIVFRV